jgi:tRNA threonylcarbamoyladenosine biosynthesis protein TsaE
VRLTSSSPSETEEIGQRLGKVLEAGDVVCLYGDLGAGKTTLVKGLASSFGINSRDVTSASFTVIAEYPVIPPFYHIDLYRIGSVDDLESTGLWDVIGGDGVSVIEWAENMGNEYKKDVIKVFLKESGTVNREIVIEGIDEKTWNNL